MAGERKGRHCPQSHPTIPSSASYDDIAAMVWACVGSAGTAIDQHAKIVGLMSDARCPRSGTVKGRLQCLSLGVMSN
jgi:hypothetical protein